MSKLTDEQIAVAYWKGRMDAAADGVGEKEKELAGRRSIEAAACAKRDARIEHLERVLVMAREAMNLAASFQEGGTLKARAAIAAIDKALKDKT